MCYVLFNLLTGEGNKHMLYPVQEGTQRIYTFINQGYQNECEKGAKLASPTSSSSGGGRIIGFPLDRAYMSTDKIFWHYCQLSIAYGIIKQLPCNQNF